MKFTIDTETNSLSTDDEINVPLFSKRGFEILSHLWLKVGWNQKYTYTFSWMGRPIIQLPDDMIRVQEVIYSIKPDVVIETGVAHGGSLIYYASLLKGMGRDDARVVGIDIDIRPHNRRAIEAHELFPMIELIEGGSTAPAVVDRVAKLVPDGARTLILLDSNHSKAHVAAELEAYHSLVSVGSYIVATDGFMSELTDVPRGDPNWKDDHPTAAAEDFVANHSNFSMVQPPWPFNESDLTENVTHWPGAWLKRDS